MALTRRVKELGRQNGFDLVRIAPATILHVERARYLHWVSEGRQAGMRWITSERAVKSADPKSVLPRAQSVVCLGLSYWAGHRPMLSSRDGAVGRYAWGADYHSVIGQRLRTLSECLREEYGGEFRWYVDTGPLMDKALAARSGLGWYGKNTNILTESFGSFVLLGEIITTLRLPADKPLQRNCGACRLCVVACPTKALGPDYTIDSGKCISYLTIEHRGPIPRELRARMGGWVFGCDICQDVCPPTMGPYLHSKQERRAWASQVRAYVNGASGISAEGLEPKAADGEAEAHTLFSHRMQTHVDLVWLLQLSHTEYVQAFRGTAIKRAKVWMLRRNAAVALGNVGSADAFAPLSSALREDVDPIIRGHAAWAIGRLSERLRFPGADAALTRAYRSERSEDVRSEIEHALTMILDAAVATAE